MANITHLLGSILVMLWMAATFMGESFLQLIPSPYAEDIIRYKWLILGFGVFLTITGLVNRYKRLKNTRQNTHRNASRWKKHEFTHYVKDYKSEQGQEQFQSSYENKKEIQSNVNSAKSAYRQTSEFDELAKTVEWSPIAGGGANFKTSYLYQPSQTRIEVKKSNGAKLFSAFFIGMGCFVPGLIAYSMFDDKGFGWGIIGMMAFGSIFVFAGIAMLYFPKPGVFDKQVGWFWAGNKKITNEQALLSLEKSARLNEIAAIQIIPERLSGKKSSYTSWEINLISQDAQRLNVMDHGNKKSIQADAQMLAEFLGVPVWENTR